MTRPVVDTLQDALLLGRESDELLVVNHVYWDGADAALASLRRLVEAAQADVADYLEWRAVPGNEHKRTAVMDELAAALAACVGDGNG